MKCQYCQRLLLESDTIAGICNDCASVIRARTLGTTMLQCKYCGVQIKSKEYCSDCALELKLAFEPDISQIPDKIEPIVAYRAWNIRDNKLSSVVKTMLFEPYQRNEAKCNYTNSNHEAPAEDCTCGFYAYKEFNNAILSGQIFGEVYLWGKIIPHKLGYRAQYCYPKRLYIVGDNILSEEMAQIYGINTIEFKEVTEYEYCNTLYDYAKYSNKLNILKEEDNAIISINYAARPQCSVCGSTDKCYTDERNHYFYCVICHNSRVKQRHIETYQNALNRIRNQQFDAINMQIPKGY